jgi:hypothetical protein
MPRAVKLELGVIASRIHRGTPLHPENVGSTVAEKLPRVDLVEATPGRYVLDIRLGRVIVEPDGARFHRNGRGRGVVVVGKRGG